MNDAIETVMSFINENTTILIIICVFLIVVLVAYLIDNTIKSKRISKNIEKEQEETKALIEKRKEEEKQKEEQEKLNAKFESAIIDNEIKKEEIVPEKKEVNLESKIEQEKIKDAVNIFPEEKKEEEIISIDNIFPVSNDEKNVQKEEIKEEKSEDKNVDVLYKNDKKLSEILFSNIEKQPEGKLDESVVKKEEEAKSLSDSAAELDAIMKKLNSYNNSDEDNFTNIF